MRINAISIIPFQKKIRIDKNDKCIDNASACTTATVLESSALASAAAAGTYSSHTTGSPTVLVSSPQNLISASTGLLSTAAAIECVNSKITKKTVPSL